MQVSAGNTPKLTNSNGCLSKLTNRNACNNGSTGKLAPNSACNSTANLTNNNVEGEMSSECSQQTGNEDDIQKLDRNMIPMIRALTTLLKFKSAPSSKIQLKYYTKKKLFPEINERLHVIYSGS